MYLKRLEIQGFKSFAKKTVLEFDKGITAVVGPNGSGKSNTADCLRWVLGEQSVKQLRGKKSDDVIFAGSEQKGRGGLAEVFATFDNRDHKIPVDSAEVSIGRRVSRSGESEYLINGNKVRLLDIVDLVLKSNIGTSRYTVIGQGTIDQFILQGPSGVKELLDEASGVKTYYMRREKTLKRLEQTAQNLMRAEDLIAEIEPRLKSLRRLAKRMEARVEIEKELDVVLKSFFGYEYHKLAREIEQVNSKLEHATGIRKAQEAEIERMLSKTSEGDEWKREQVKKLEEIRTDTNKLQHEKNKLLEHLSLLKGKIESVKTGNSNDPESIRANLHTLKTKIQEENNALHNIKTEETAAKSNLSEATSKLSEVNRKLEEVYNQLSEPHEINTAKIAQELGSLEASFNQFFHIVESTIDVQLVRQSTWKFRDLFQSFSKTTHGELTSPQQTMGKLKELLQKLLGEKEHIQGVLSSMSVEVSKTSVARDYTEKQIEAFEEEKRRLELELSRLSNTDSDFLAHVAKEEERVKGELASLEGTISKLQNEMQLFYKDEQNAREVQNTNDKILREKQARLTQLHDAESLFSVEKAKLETNMENMLREMHSQIGEEGVSHVKSNAVQNLEPGTVGNIERLRHQLDLAGGVDELTMKEHSETEMRFGHLSAQVEDLRKAMQDLRSVMDELDQHIATSFNQAFHKINEKFEYYFRVLFNGGRAFLSVVKSDQQSEMDEEISELSENEEPKDTKLRPEEKLVKKYEQGKNVIVGIDIKATPPGKKLSTIQALSGGERALTSIALLCSLLSSFPSPFVMLDEVDAALDEANTMRFGQILGTLSHQTQFITITHNRETMAQANTIYGVTMGDDGISKLLSIKFDQAKAFAK